jgi:dipeptidyl aminopeptidase/acylaminoacyl peptidase
LVTCAGLLVGLAAATAAGSDGTPTPPLMTVAEQSDYTRTAGYDDVMALCRQLDKRSDLVTMRTLGTSREGRPIPLLVVGKPEAQTLEHAADDGRLVVLLVGNIHAGEVCGKEALPMLVRDLTDAPGSPLLDQLVLLVVPIFNPDGNERLGPNNRPGQDGPALTGTRENAQGLDLNRDFLKLESPEVRALVGAINTWDPHVVVDTHTTNGSLHRYVLTYQGPQHPAGSAAVREYVRTTLIPDVDAAFESATGQGVFYYGDFADDHTRWVGFPDSPRFGTNYVGLRDRIGILTEAYAYAPFRDRVLATRSFVQAILNHASAHADDIRHLLVEARRAAENRDPGATIPIRSKAVARSGAETVQGFVETRNAAGKLSAGEPRDYQARVELEFEPTLAVRPPFAYVVPPQYASAINALIGHGIRLQRLSQETTLEATARTITGLDRASRPYQGHATIRLEASEPSPASSRRIPAGSVLVESSQPLGALVVNLLEPASADGLATWNLFDGPALGVGAEFPVLRLETKPAEPLPQEAPAEPRRRVTFDTLISGPRPTLTSRPIQVKWLDPDHWLETRPGGRFRVEARTGKAEPFLDEKALAQAIDAKLDDVDGERALAIAAGAVARLDPDRKGFTFDQGDDLVHATLDGAEIVRVPISKGPRELTTFSPDGTKLAFVRDNDLYVVDIPSRTERRLTTGGSDLVRHGKADWVYYEEIFDRNWQAYWWSPDSKRIAFLECDDSPVGTHVVLNETASPTSREVESTHYPRAGDPNPKVRIGIVRTDPDDPTVVWARVAGDDQPEPLVYSAVGWLDADHPYAYAQNRTQTYLNLARIDAQSGTSDILFRDQTGAWVDSPGTIHTLASGEFLYPSDRTGWRHLYRYSADGKTCTPVTTGPFEVRSVELVDEPNGWVYVLATKDNSVATNLYRARLDGTGDLERLSTGDGDHSISLNTDGSLFVDTRSTIATPPKTELFDAKGQSLRVVSDAPIPDLARYDLAPRRRMQLPTRDGFLLEAEIVLPPTIDPNKSYAAWFMTYGGPHSPTISDGWAGSQRLLDQALASEGYVVFRMDPRSASGKGAVSAHAAYKQLGVQEMKDIEDGIAWLLKTYPFVDPTRLGMAGHSYGGYMTSYAMTHSKLFAAGIAGAPVTDWRDYDSIYTERFMLTPQENPEGYKVSSVVSAAGDLHGRLLILHGGIDDNVSIRNTIRLVHALQLADKDFELMLYPAARHGIFGPHYQRIQLDFIRRTLGGPKVREKIGE